MTKTQRKRILAMHRDGVSYQVCFQMIVSLVSNKYIKHKEIHGLEGKYYDVVITDLTKHNSEIAHEIKLFIDNTSDGQTCALDRAKPPYK